MCGRIETALRQKADAAFGRSSDIAEGLSAPQCPKCDDGSLFPFMPGATDVHCSETQLCGWRCDPPRTCDAAVCRNAADEGDDAE